MRRTPIEWVLEVLTLTILIGVFAYLAFHWGSVADRVPAHYGFSGKPDRWGGKSNLLILPSVMLLLWIFLTIASRFKKFPNLPEKIDRNHPKIQEIILNFSIILKLVLVSQMGYISIQSVRVALGRTDGLGSLPVIMSLVTTMGVVLYYMGKLNDVQMKISSSES